MVHTKYLLTLRLSSERQSKDNLQIKKDFGFYHRQLSTTVDNPLIKLIKLLN